MKFVVTAVTLLSFCLVPATLEAGTFKSRVCSEVKSVKERVRLLPLKLANKRCKVKRVVVREVVEIPVEKVDVEYSTPVRNLIFGTQRIVPCASKDCKK
tara:strand:- start:29254 stop:29550 length:297 start_codon:yes stop_codon:yes gene_type:complete